jgi:hypothetical protein
MMVGGFAAQKNVSVIEDPSPTTTFERTDHSPASLRGIRTSHVCPTFLTHVRKQLLANTLYSSSQYFLMFRSVRSILPESVLFGLLICKECVMRYINKRWVAQGEMGG